jgi:hypothetical protein
MLKSLLCFYYGGMKHLIFDHSTFQFYKTLIKTQFSFGIIFYPHKIFKFITYFFFKSLKFIIYFDIMFPFCSLNYRSSKREKKHHKKEEQEVVKKEKMGRSRSRSRSRSYSRGRKQILLISLLS